MKVLPCHLEDNWYLYLLKLSDNKYYVGISHDPDARLVQHQNDAVPSTRYRTPQRVGLYFIGNYVLASKIERYLHRLHDKDVIKFLDNPDFISNFIEHTYHKAHNSLLEYSIIEQLVEI